jgi:hypothetical protein
VDVLDGRGAGVAHQQGVVQRLAEPGRWRADPLQADGRLLLARGRLGGRGRGGGGLGVDGRAHLVVAGRGGRRRVERRDDRGAGRGDVEVVGGRRGWRVGRRGRDVHVGQAAGGRLPPGEGRPAGGAGGQHDHRGGGVIPSHPGTSRRRTTARSGRGCLHRAGTIATPRGRSSRPVRVLRRRTVADWSAAVPAALGFLALVFFLGLAGKQPKAAGTAALQSAPPCPAGRAAEY